MSGLFDTFTVAKRGLNVQQGNINTTSHNISNASTVGYSRQRAVIETTRPFGGTSKYDSCIAGQVGTGAQITTIQRVRDAFKDYQVRAQRTGNGELNAKNSYLTQTEDILNETSDTGIQQALSDFYKGFQSLSGDPTKSSNRTVALQQAQTLASLLNNRYTQLETKKSDAQATMNTDVTDINSILDQINGLNEQIAGVSAIGMTPNDLMDKRDNLLDDLSKKFGINVNRDKFESIDVASSELSSPQIGKLVDGNDFTAANCNRFSYVQSATLTGTTLQVKYAVLGDPNNIQTIPITGADEALRTEVLEKRILIAGKNGIVTPVPTNKASIENALFSVQKGEIGGKQDVQKNIQNCMDDLDKFAAGLAYTVNAIQTGSQDGTANANLKYNDPIFVTAASNGGTATDTGINAKNIAVNSILNKEPSRLNCGLSQDDVSGEHAGTRALAIASVRNIKMDLDKITVSSTSTRAMFYSGTTAAGISLDSDKQYLNTSTSGATLDNYYKSVISDLATVTKGVASDLSNSEIQLQIYENDRLSESGVSIDEETTNLIQYQHAYQANAKVISTVDQLLDVVINGLKR